MKWFEIVHKVIFQKCNNYQISLKAISRRSNAIILKPEKVSSHTDNLELQKLFLKVILTTMIIISIFFFTIIFVTYKVKMTVFNSPRALNSKWLQILQKSLKPWRAISIWFKLAIIYSNISRFADCSELKNVLIHLR